MNQKEDILHNGFLENLPDYTIFKKKTNDSRRYINKNKRTLSKWYITFVKNNNPRIEYKYWISINGLLQNKNMIQSSPILGIDGANIIYTENSKYYLQGNSCIMEKPPHKHFGFSELNKFKNGFPTDWKDIIISEMTRLYGSCRIKIPTNVKVTRVDAILNDIMKEDGNNLNNIIKKEDTTTNNININIPDTINNTLNKEIKIQNNISMENDIFIEDNIDTLFKEQVNDKDVSINISDVNLSKMDDLLPEIPTSLLGNGSNTLDSLIESINNKRLTRRREVSHTERSISKMAEDEINTKLLDNLLEESINNKKIDLNINTNNELLILDSSKINIPVESETNNLQNFDITKLQNPEMTHQSKRKDDEENGLLDLIMSSSLYIKDEGEEIKEEEMSSEKELEDLSSSSIKEEISKSRMEESKKEGSSMLEDLMNSRVARPYSYEKVDPEKLKREEIKKANKEKITNEKSMEEEIEKVKKKQTKTEKVKNENINYEKVINKEKLKGEKVNKEKPKVENIEINKNEKVRQEFVNKSMESIILQDLENNTVISVKPIENMTVTGIDLEEFPTSSFLSSNASVVSVRKTGSKKKRARVTMTTKKGSKKKKEDATL